MDITGHLRLPDDLIVDKKRFEAVQAQESLTVDVSSSYLSYSWDFAAVPEVIAIQRLLSLARGGKLKSVQWPKDVADRVLQAPAIFPLLAVLLCLESLEHRARHPAGLLPLDLDSSRQTLYKYRLQTDMFSDTQTLICADSLGHGRPKSLYSSSARGLIEREAFDSMVERLLAGQAALSVDASKAVAFSQTVATIVAELFENTDIHGRTGLDGVPFRHNGIRGLIFKRIKLQRPKRQRMGQSGPAVGESAGGDSDVLEISVFDSGVGFYSSYTGKQLEPDTPVEAEWKVMHKCLERHFDNARPAHTGMGLYEVLRALNYLRGKLEVRSGRTYGFRTFLAGEPKFQHESRESQARPGMPKPVLLDFTRQFVTVPEAQEQLVGASVRVLVPLH